MSINRQTMERWRADPAAFVETVLYNPETDEPFVLLDAERAFLKHAFQLDENGRLLYQEQCYGAPKKTGKTGFGALHQLTTILLFGGKYAEGYALANDQEQAQSRVFQAVKRIVECSPLLRKEARITADKIIFPGFFGAAISAVASDYSSMAGANPTHSVFDEAWAYTSERLYRLWDEMVPSPVRKISLRLVVTHAGFSNELTLLEGLYQRGMKLPLVAPDLRAGDGLLFYWTHSPQAPWQTQGWIDEMRRTLRPHQFLRMVENRFTSTESSFIDMEQWDACVDPNNGRAIADRSLAAWIGVDAGIKRDLTALVAVTFDQPAQKVRQITHRVFQPSPDDPLDFEATIESTLLDWRRRLHIAKVLFDPWQMQSTAQRLQRAGLPIEEFPQTPANLTAASQNLFELITGNNLRVYPDAGMRLAISRAVAVETPRGWRISKEKQSHKIDVVVALAMAAHAAVEGQASAPLRIHPDNMVALRARAPNPQFAQRRMGAGLPGIASGHGPTIEAVGERRFYQMMKRRSY